VKADIMPLSRRYAVFQSTFGSAPYSPLEWNSVVYCLTDHLMRRGW
jgi:hypothetical protein